MISSANQWAQIELHHLIALQAIAQTGSFGRGALVVGYSQSAISQQISALETLVGERLVERSRGPGRVALTEAGQLLLRHAEAIVAHLQAAQADVAAYRAGEAGVLRVGTYQSVGVRLLPAVARAFSAAWPNVELHLKEDAQEDQLLAPVAAGTLDLAFVVLPLLDGPFEATELLTDPWVLLVAGDAPLARERGPVPLRALDQQALIGFQHCRTTHMIEQPLAEHQVTAHTVFRSDDNGTVRGMVATRMGVALVPLLTCEPDPRVVVRALADPIPPRRIGLAWHRDRYRSAAAQAFIETARRRGQELQVDLDAQMRALTASPPAE